MLPPPPLPPPFPSPQASSLTSLITHHPHPLLAALPLEIQHNLQHQHRWTDLDLHLPLPLSPSSPPRSPPLSTRPPGSSLPPEALICGLPPTRLYTHPDHQRRLLQLRPPPQPVSSSPSSASSSPLAALTLAEPEREWVLPSTVNARWTLERLAAVFDWLPEREAVTIPGRKGVEEGGGGNEEEEEEDRERRVGKYWHQDAKRLVLAIKAHEGGGGDGSVVYYVVQEGCVKPRQN